MQLWRISNYATLNGEGGLLYSARWNIAGTPIVYLAASPAGALIEALVHLEVERDDLPTHYQLLEVSAPDNLLIEELSVETTNDPDAWRLNVGLTRSIGDAWLKSNRSVLARVPSAILPATANYLLNPGHPHANRLRIQQITKAKYDPRLFIRK